MSPGVSCSASGNSLRLNSARRMITTRRHDVKQIVDFSSSFTDTCEHTVSSVNAMLQISSTMTKALPTPVLLKSLPSFAWEASAVNHWWDPIRISMNVDAGSTLMMRWLASKRRDGSMSHTTCPSWPPRLVHHLHSVCHVLSQLLGHLQRKSLGTRATSIDPFREDTRDRALATGSSFVPSRSDVLSFGGPSRIGFTGLGVCVKRERECLALDASLVR